MLRLCSLIILASVSMGTGALGLTQTFYTTVEADVRNGSLDISDLSRKYNVSNISERVGYRVDNIIPSISIQGFVVGSQPDYSSVLVRNQLGQESTLKDQVGSPTEFSTELNADWVLGDNTFGLGWSGNLSGSPFSKSSTKLSYQRGFFGNTSLVGVSAVYLDQSQPDSYYFDDLFQIQKRPEHVYGNEVRLHYEQILTENWKSRMELSTSERAKERPRSWHVLLKNGYAISDRLFASGELSYGTEGRSQTLLNERGYFDQWGGKVELTYEPLYDFLVSVSYGLMIERESIPTSGRVLQVASDQYGLGATYQMRQVDLNLQAGYIQTNSNIYNYLLSGGATWRL